MNELNENMHKNVNSPEEQHKHVLKIHKSLTGSGYTPETEKHLDVKNHTSNSNIHHVTYTSPGKKNKVLQYGKAGFPIGHHAGLLDSKHMKESMTTLTNEILEAMDQEEFDALVEDYEQLDELSKATLGSYVKMAAIDVKEKGYDAGYQDGGEAATTLPSRRESPGQVTDNKAYKRLGKINKAVNKIVAKESVSEQTLELIDAIESGKSTAIETSFNEIMANKLVAAIDNRRQEIASGLFGVQEDTVEEAIVPGSVKKDKEGNVTRFTSVADKNIRQKEIDRRNKERQRELQGRSATRSNGQPLDTEE